MRPIRSTERGAALFAVLAMLALLAGFATLGLQRLRAATDRVSDAEAQAQAMLVAQSGLEAGAHTIHRLKALSRQQPELLTAPITIRINDGRAILRFADASSCFNLNSLAPGARGTRPQTSPAQFAKLLGAAGVPPMETREIANATAKLLAEKRLLWADASEWLTVPGIKVEYWAAAGPLLCALPNREATAININFIRPEQAPLLVAVGMEPDEARRALANRPREGWTSGGQFFEAGSSSGTPDTSGAEVVGISSRWLTLTIDASHGDATVRRRYLLDTIANPARVAASYWLPPGDSA
ncbi:MAG: type II secretion system minor pseudopilin GspK [Sphingomonadaceae bacterium]